MLTSEWKKSTKSNPSGNCVECKFVKSSKSLGDHNNCVEISRTGLHDSLILVRDSKDPDNPGRTVLSYTQDEWMKYLKLLKMGHGALYYNGVYVIVRWNGILKFNEDEWEAFMTGVWKGEFDIPLPIQ